MSEYKNYSRDESKSDLKKADSEKNGELNIQHINSELFGSGTRTSYLHKKKILARKKLPVAVDVIIAILMLAFAAGIAVGAYFVFRYFTVDYESVSVEYTLLVYDADEAPYTDLVNSHLYTDNGGNTVYFGKIIAVENYEEEGAVLITVALNAKYRSEDGYYADSSRIAVGSTYNVRTDTKSFSGAVVELVKRSSPQKVNFALGLIGNRSVMVFGGVD